MLSTEIASAAELLRAYALGHLQPSKEALGVLADRLDTCEAGAIKLERMLERRLKAAPLAVVPLPSAEIIPLRRAGQPIAAPMAVIEGGVA